MMKKNLLNILLIALIVGGKSFAQPVEQIVKVVVAPDHSDWVYKTGENVKFSIAVLPVWQSCKKCSDPLRDRARKNGSDKKRFAELICRHLNC